jgi:hypothetical protein
VLTRRRIGKGRLCAKLEARPGVRANHAGSAVGERRVRVWLVRPLRQLRHTPVEGGVKTGHLRQTWQAIGHRHAGLTLHSTNRFQSETEQVIEVSV